MKKSKPENKKRKSTEKGSEWWRVGWQKRKEDDEKEGEEGKIP